MALNVDQSLQIRPRSLITVMINLPPRIVEGVVFVRILPPLRNLQVMVSQALAKILAADHQIIEVVVLVADPIGHQIAAVVRTKEEETLENRENIAIGQVLPPLVLTAGHRAHGSSVEDVKGIHLNPSPHPPFHLIAR